MYERIARDIPSGFNYEDFNRVKEEQRIYAYQRDLKETKWRRDRIGIAEVRETERGKREIKNAGVKDREEEKERGESGPKVARRARAQTARRIQRRRRGRRGERGAHLHPGGSYFPFFREGY